MKCERTNEELQAFLDDELTPEDRSRVADHLASCEECRAVLKDLRDVSAVLARWAAPEPSSLPTASSLLARAGVEVASSVSIATPESNGGEARDRESTLPAPDSSNRRRFFAAAAAIAVCALTAITLQVYRGGRGDDLVSAPRQPSFSAPSSAGGSAYDAPNSSTAGAPSSPARQSASNEASPQAQGEAGKVDADAQNQIADASPPPADGIAASSGNEAPAVAPAPAVAQPAAPRSEEVAATSSETIASEEKQKKILADEESDRPSESRAALPMAGRQVTNLLAKRGSIAVDVADSEKAADRISAIASSAGGYVESRGSARANDRKGVAVTIRVPSDKFESVVSSLRALGTVRNYSTSSENVGDDLAELDAKERESRDDGARKDKGSAPAKSAPSKPGGERRRAQIVDRARMATVTVTVTQQP